MKTTKKTTKKLKIIGKEEYINKETGELQEMQVIKMEDRDFNFEKLWLVHILDSLEAVGNKKIKVMNTLLAMKNKDNLIIASQEKIGLIAEVSKPVVNQTISILIESNFLKKVQSGVYMINPDILFKGGRNNRMNILLEYTKNDTEETKVSENPDTYIQTDNELNKTQKDKMK